MVPFLHQTQDRSQRSEESCSSGMLKHVKSKTSWGLKGLLEQLIMPIMPYRSGGDSWDYTWQPVIFRFPKLIPVEGTAAIVCGGGSITEYGPKPHLLLWVLVKGCKNW